MTDTSAAPSDGGGATASVNVTQSQTMDGSAALGNAPKPTNGGDFRSALSKDYQDKYTEFKTGDDLMKGYDSLVKKMGQNPLVRPSDDASDEDKSAYISSLKKELGAPEDISAYEVSLPDTLPPEVAGLFDADRVDGFRQIALEHGMTKDGFNAMFDHYAKTTMTDFEAFNTGTQQAYDSAVKSMKEAWGDKYDENVEKAKKFAEKHAPDFLKDENLERYGNDPVILNMLANLADRTGETFDGEPSGFADVSTADEMRERAKELNMKAMDDTIPFKERNKALEDAKAIYQKLSKSS